MSDYMFMLESHLSTEQNRVVAEVQAGAAEANMSVFLTGGAMRDMLGGFPIRDLDFAVEGDALKLAHQVARKAGAAITAEDEHLSTAEIVFPGGVNASLGMTRTERYPRPGARPQVARSGIHEDLRRRDFTANAIALSLNRASRGLLIDPTNGLGDLERKELRAVYNYALYDDPSRILRLVRLRVRLGFAVAEKTRAQYENVRAERLEERIPPRRLFEELRQTADEPNAADVLRALEEENLLYLFSPALAGAKLNLAGLVRLQKARQQIPYGVRFPVNNLGLFLSVLTERLTPKEKAGLAKATAMTKQETELWQRLEARARRVEREVKAARVGRPSNLYQLLAKVPGDQILYLLVRSQLRVVQDRIKAHLQKYLPLAQEVTDEEVKAKGFRPGTSKFEKARAELIAAKLNARPKRPPPEEAEAPQTPEPAPPATLKRALRQPSARR